MIVTDFTGAPQDLFFIVLTWLHAAYPPAKPDTLKSHVDIIDHEKADVSLAVDLAGEVREGRPCPLSLWRTDARRNPLRFGFDIFV